MALSVAEVRQRVATALEALNGWTESRYHPDLFGADTASLLHLSFAVGTPTTDVFNGERPKLRHPATVETAVDVRVAYRIRGDAQVADTDLATAAEQAGIKAVHAISRNDLQVAFRGIARELRGDGTWQISTIRFQTIHLYDLQ